MIEERELDLSTATALPSLPRCERIAWGRAWDATYRHETGQRRRTHGAIQITLDGCGALLRPDGSIVERIPRGRALVFVARTHRIHYGVPPGGRWEFLYANLDGGATAVLAEMVAAHGHVLAVDADHPLITTLRDLLPDAGTAHRRMPLADNARLAQDILHLAIAGQETGGRDAGLVDAAMAALSADLARPPTIATVASRLGITREHLTRLFVRHGGTAPATWLRRQRLRAAELLVRGGDLPMAAIAQRTGFASASHFIAAFRNEMGVPPSRYRRGG